MPSKCEWNSLPTSVTAPRAATGKVGVAERRSDFAGNAALGAAGHLSTGIGEEARCEP